MEQDWLQKIRKIVRQQPSQPERDLWPDIQDRLEMENAWQSINDELQKEEDINLAWKGIQQELSRERWFHQLESLSHLPLTVLLLFLLWSMGWQIPYEQDKGLLATQQLEEKQALPEISVETFQIENYPRQVIEEREKSDRAILEDRPAGRSIKKEPKAMLTSMEKLPEQQPEDESNVLDDWEPTWTRLPSFDRSAMLSLSESLETSQEAILSMVIDPIGLPTEKEPISERRNGLKNKSFYYGAGISMNRGWLLDHRRRNAWMGNDLVQVAPVNSYNWSLHAGLALHPEWSIQSHLDLFSSIGQQYSEFNNGNFQTGENQLSYMGLQLGLRKSIHLAGNIQPKLKEGLLAGFFINYVYSATEERRDFASGEVIRSFPLDEYRDWEKGLWMAYEMTYPMAKHVELGSQLNFRYGLNNLYQGNDHIPYYLRQARTTELSLVLFMRFR